MGVGAGGVFLVAGCAGGVLGGEEAEDDEALGFGAEGDHAAVPQGAVEWGEAGFGVFAVAVEGLVDGGVVGDLEEVFGAVEAGLGVALALALCADGAGDADGLAVLMGAAGAGDVEQVVPAVGVGAGAAFEFAGGQGG
ncbi:hypothetical protein ABR737_19665 [Streptomyces sp. Edi2]|uniref:hypothetical protein n=1 Tax=Streptomyces sp. Edi2 TaxID=3162528 RepID=UPI0033061955